MNKNKSGGDYDDDCMENINQFCDKIGNISDLSDDAWRR